MPVTPDARSVAERVINASVGANIGTLIEFARASRDAASSDPTADSAAPASVAAATVAALTVPPGL